MRRSYTIDSVLLVILAMLLLAGFAFLLMPVHAQDATPAPISPPIETLPEIPTSPAGAIAAYTFFGGSALVTLLVSLEKKFVPESISAEVLKQWTAIVVTIIFVVLVYSGNVSWFSKGADVLTNVLPYVTGIIGVLFGSSALHNLSAKVGIPLAGYKRG